MLMLLSEQVERIISYHQDLPKRILEVLSRSLGKGSFSASCQPCFFISQYTSIGNKLFE
jgi:hypothetical protein